MLEESPEDGSVSPEPGSVSPEDGSVSPEPGSVSPELGSGRSGAGGTEKPGMTGLTSRRASFSCWTSLESRDTCTPNFYTGGRG